MDVYKNAQEELVLNTENADFDMAAMDDSDKERIAAFSKQWLKIDEKKSKCFYTFMYDKCDPECKNRMIDFCVARMTEAELNLYHEIMDEDYYFRFIREVEVCRSLDELAKVVLKAVDRGKLTKKRVVQSAFIELLLPFCQPFGRGGQKPSVGAVRTHINKILIENHENKRMQKNAGVS